MYVRTFFLFLCFYVISAFPAPEPQEEQNDIASIDADLSTDDPSSNAESVTEDSSEESVTEKQLEESDTDNPADTETQVLGADETEDEKSESENQKPGSESNDEENDEESSSDEIPTKPSDSESSDDVPSNKITLSIVMAFGKLAKVTSAERKHDKIICQQVLLFDVIVDERCHNVKKNEGFGVDQELVIMDSKIINSQRYFCQEIIKPHFGPLQELCIGRNDWVYNPIPIEKSDYFGLFVF